jgi:hypothetical protein
MRVKGVVSILESVESENINNLPKTMQPENVKVAAILPINFDICGDEEAVRLVENCIVGMSKAKYVSDFYVVSREKLEFPVANCKWIDRRQIEGVDEMGLDEVLKETLSLIEEDGCFSDLILYVNHRYSKRPEGIFDQLITEVVQKGLETGFPALIDYGHYWFLGDEGNYVQTDSSMKNRAERSPIYRAIYGLGTVTSTHLIRKGIMVGDEIGIIKVDEVYGTTNS